MPRIPANIKRAITARTVWAGQIKELTTNKDDADSIITAWLTKNAELLSELVQGKPRVSVTVGIDPDTQVTATLVRPTTQVLDEDELARRIGTKVYNTLTKTVVVLDEAKLQEAIATGRIKAEDFTASMSEVPSKAFTRFTVSKIKKGKVKK
jgi:hypothetical protein